MLFLNRLLGLVAATSHYYTYTVLLVPQFVVVVDLVLKLLLHSIMCFKGSTSLL